MFLTVQWRVRHTGSSAQPESSITIYIGECKDALYVYAATHGPTSLSC